MNSKEGERKIGKGSKWYIEKKCELRKKDNVTSNQN